MAVGPVTRTVRTLIQKGLVAKGGVAGHHRSERLDLTEAGLTLLQQDPLNDVDRAITALGARQQQMLAGILGQIITALNSRGDDGIVNFEDTFLGEVDGLDTNGGLDDQGRSGEDR
jgi:DNA-binding MarR family transcriptional regulator